MKGRVLVKVIRPAFEESRKKGRWFVRDRFLRFAYRGTIPANISRHVESGGSPFFWVKAGTETAPEFIGQAPEQGW